MHLLIPAAGIGKRMGGTDNKLHLSLLGKSLLSWTLKAAVAAEQIEWIGVIGQPYDFDRFQAVISQLPPQGHVPIQLIQGGDTRQASVFNGLQALPSQAQRVLIHDGARCLATPDLFNRCSKALTECSGCIAAIPVKDTIKVVNDDGWITDTPNRQQLWAAQTPQGFDVALLKQCHHQGWEQQWQVTDDAALLEKCGHPVKMVPGEETNLKITTPVDLAIAEFILRQRSGSI